MRPFHKSWHAMRQNAPLLLCLFGVALYLYCNLFTFHNIPHLRIGDQGVFWEYALRMLQGDHPYRDFFQYTPPGTDLFYLTLFKLFGPSYAVANFGLILLGLALFVACFSVTHRILSGAQALFAATVVTVFIFGERLDGTHHWFSLILCLCAVRAIMPGRTTLRIISAGALCGFASFFTQTAGAAVLIALLLSLLWEHFASAIPPKETLKRIAILVTAFVLLWFALNAHFIVDAGWQKFFYLQVTYPQRYVKERNIFLVPNMIHTPLRQLSVYLSLAIYPVILWRCWRRRRAFDPAIDMQIVLLTLTGLMLMLQIATRAEWTRIYAIASPAVLLLVWATVRFTSTSIRRAALIAMGCATLYLAIVQTHARQHSGDTIALLPTGQAVLPPTQLEEYTWIGQHTAPGDFFFQANWMDVFLPLELRDPVYSEDFRPNERARPEMVALAVQQIEQKKVRYLLWSPQWSNSSHADTPASDHLEPLRSYIRSHYTRVHVFSNDDEIWQRL